MENATNIILKKIYSSCDTENTNKVPVSVLIEFIKPYLYQDLAALETLKTNLDPENTDALISGERFYQIMDEWITKNSITHKNNGDREFNGIDAAAEKCFHFSHSTPYASFQQKQINSANFFDCSMLSNIPTKDNDTKNETLEEKVNELREQMEVINSQLVATEFQNKILQTDLTRYRIRLQNEQQINDHFKKDKNGNEELKKEISFLKTQLEELTKKLQHHEKDTTYMSLFIKEVEKENTMLTSSRKDFEKREETFSTEIFNFQTQLELKNIEESIIAKYNEDLKVRSEYEKEVNENLTIDYSSVNPETRFSSKLSCAPYTVQSSYSTFSIPSQSYSFEDEDSSENENARCKIELPKEVVAIGQEYKLSVSKAEKEIKDLVQENKKIYRQLSESYKKFDEVYKQLHQIKLKNQELENVIKNTSGHSSNELADELNQLKDDYENLKISIRIKENELGEYKNKFNFELAYKNLQTEFNLKTKELEETKRFCKQCQEETEKLYNKNGGLGKTLKQVNLDPFQTDNNSEVLVLNNMYGDLIDRLKHDLKEKDYEVNQLEEKLRYAMKSNTDVQKVLGELEEKNNIMSTKTQEVDKTEEEYAKMLSIEVSKNSVLQQQISEQESQLYVTFNKYQEETSKNVKLTEQVKELEEELEKIRSSYNKTKESIDKKVLVYEELVKKYDNEIQDLENRNKFLHNSQINNTTKDYEEEVNKCEEQIINYQIEIKELETDIHILKSQTKNKNVEIFENSLENVEKPVDEIQTLSFDTQKLITEELRQKCETLELQLLEEKSKNNELEKRLKEDFVVNENEGIVERQRLQNTVEELREQLSAQQEYYKELGQASSGKIKELSFKVAQLEEVNQNVQFELNERIKLVRNQSEAKCTVISKLDENLKKIQTRNQELVQNLKEKDTLVTEFREQNKKFQEATENLKSKINEFSMKLAEQEQEIAFKNEQLLKLTDQIQDKNETIVNLKNSVTNLDTRLSQTFRKLLEKSEEFEALLDTNKALQEKLSKTDDSKEKELKEYETFKTKISEQTNVIQNCCKKLYKALAVVIENYGDELQKDAKCKVLLQMEDRLPKDAGDQLSCLTERVSIVVVLIEIFATKASEIQYLRSSGEHKLLNKFTLGPTQYRENHSSSGGTSCGDSHNILNKDVDNENMEPFLPVSLHFDEAFPHLTDTFLKTFRLYQDQREEKFTKEETEKIFTVLAKQVFLDYNGVGDILEKQQNHCHYQHKKCFHLMKNILSLLKDHTCVGTSGTLSQMLVLVEDLRLLLQELIPSVGQLGILSCKSRMTKCWELTINYAKSLKKELMKTKQLVEKDSDGRYNISLEESNKLKNKILQTKSYMKSYIGYACSTFLKNSFTWFIAIIFLVFSVVIMADWQCQITTDNSYCLMTEFVKKIHIGRAPY